MTPGILSKQWPDAGAMQATRTPEGWQSEQADFAEMLTKAFPSESTEVGTPWIRSFYAAANSLGAEILQKPEPGEWNMGKQQTGGDFLGRFRATVMGKRLQKTRDSSGHEHASDGKFTSGGGGSAKPKDKPDAKPDAPKTESKPGEKAKGVLAKLGGKLSALVDKVPVVGHLKRGMQAAMGKIHDVAAKRYGPKTAKAIMSSGTVADAVLMGGGALLTGMPIVTGANQLIGIIPAFVLAEGKYQLGKLMGKAMELEGEEFDKACEEIAGMITDAFQELLDKHGDELKAAFPGKALHGGFLKRFSAVLKGKEADLGDETERINLIADILYHVYGDDAIKFFDEGKQEKAWDAAAHPRGANGRFIPKGSAEAAGAAKAQIAETLKKPKTPESHKELAEHLNLLTVKQLGELKKEYQISAAGRTKKELVGKLAERLSKGRTGGEKPEGESPSYAEWGRQERESRKPGEKPADQKPSQKLTREQRQGEQSAKFALQLAERNGPLDPIVAERLAEQLQGHPRAQELLDKVRAVTRKEEKPAEQPAAKQPADLNTNEGKQRFYEAVAEAARERHNFSGLIPVDEIASELGISPDELKSRVWQMQQHDGTVKYTHEEGGNGYIELDDRFPQIAAPTASPEDKAKIKQSVQETFQNLLANHPEYSKLGMVPIHEVRAKIRELHGPKAASHAVLNDAIMDMWRDGKIGLQNVSDFSDTNLQQLTDSIPADHTSPWFYLEPKRGSQPDQKPQGEKPENGYAGRKQTYQEQYRELVDDFNRRAERNEELGYGSADAYAKEALRQRYRRHKEHQEWLASPMVQTFEKIENLNTDGVHVRPENTNKYGSHIQVGDDVGGVRLRASDFEGDTPAQMKAKLEEAAQKYTERREQARQVAEQARAAELEQKQREAKERDARHQSLANAIESDRLSAQRRAVESMANEGRAHDFVDNYPDLKSKYEQVLSKNKESVAGVLQNSPPNSPVDIAELHEKTGLSLASLHHALQKLRDEGVINFVDKKPSKVSDKQRDAAIKTRTGKIILQVAHQGNVNPNPDQKPQWEKPLHEKLRDIFKPK